MKSFADIIDRWPSDSGPPKRTSLQVFSDDLGVKYVTAQVMRHRNSIAPRYWEGLVDAAKRRKIKGVTLALLFKLKAQASQVA